MLHFRPAKSKDIPGLAILMAACGLYKGKKNDWIYDRLETLFSEKIFLVALKTYFFKTRVVGYYVITTLKTNLDKAEQYMHAEDKPLNKDYAYSGGIGTDPEFRGQNIGTRMKLFAERYLRQKGFKGMYVDIFVNNESSIRIQEKTGFKELCRYFDAKHRPEHPHINVVFMKKFN